MEKETRKTGNERTRLDAAACSPRSLHTQTPVGLQKRNEQSKTANASADSRSKAEPRIDAQSSQSSLDSSRGKRQQLAASASLQFAIAEAVCEWLLHFTPRPPVKASGVAKRHAGLEASLWTGA